MWVVAGVLLGFVVLASLVGFHVGPHAHALAGGIGVATAIWLLVMIATGQTAPVLYVLLGADTVVSAGVGTAAWKGLKGLPRHHDTKAPNRLEGKEGVAVTDLSPNGVVRVHGESWSASAVNGNVAKGSAIQVIDSSGVILRVWGQETLPINDIEPHSADSTTKEGHA